MGGFFSPRRYANMPPENPHGFQVHLAANTIELHGRSRQLPTHKSKGVHFFIPVK
jgi:hypothetical protein